jgi:hypothetical protein
MVRPFQSLTLSMFVVCCVCLFYPSMYCIVNIYVSVVVYILGLLLVYIVDTCKMYLRYYYTVWYQEQHSWYQEQSCILL